MVKVLQSLVVRLSSQQIQSESSKTGRLPRYGKRGKETLSFFEQRWYHDFRPFCESWFLFCQFKLKE